MKIPTVGAADEKQLTYTTKTMLAATWDKLQNEKQKRGVMLCLDLWSRKQKLEVAKMQIKNIKSARKPVNLVKEMNWDYNRKIIKRVMEKDLANLEEGESKTCLL